MKKKMYVFASLVIATNVLLAACGKEEKKPTSNTNTTESKYAKDQTLHLIETAEIPSMDSTIATDAVSLNVMNNTMEGLYRLGKDQKATPGMAKSVDVSKDGKTYTFHLRDAKWSNGDAVTAKDFVFSWKRAVDPKVAAEYAYILGDVKNATEISTGKMAVDKLGVEAKDDKTLVVELNQPVPYFLELLAFPTFFPLNEKFVTAQGEKNGLESSSTLYNGPFVLDNWSHDQGWTLKKNDQYWDKEAVKLKAVDYKVVKDVGTGVNLYEAGDVDRAGLAAEFVDKYKNDNNYGTEKEPTVFFLRFNHENKVFKNEDARAAVAHAVDRQAMVDVILNNGSMALNAFVPKDFAFGPDGKDFRKTNNDMIKYDVKKAQKAWEAAKKELKMDKITLTLLNTDTDVSKKISEYYKGELEKNLPGLTVNLKQIPFAQKLELESNVDYDFSMGGWGPDYPDPMTFMDMFVTDGGHNQMKYSDKEYDKLITSAKKELDQVKRWNNLTKAEQILLDDYAIAPIYQRSKAFVQKPYVKDVVSHATGGDYSFKWAYVGAEKDK